MRTSLIALFGVVLAVAPCDGQDRPSVLIVYYSVTGHTRTMAEAVAEGALSVEEVDVILLSVDQATTDDVLSAGAIIIGSPVHNANVAPAIQTFMNRWPFEDAPLAGKIGAAFVTAGGISAGEELVQLSILHSMLIFGMIVVGGPDWTQPFGASAVTFERPFNSPDSLEIAPAFRQKGFALGRRVAELTKNLHQ